MVGQSDKFVVCCFCGLQEHVDKAIKITLSSKIMIDEQQTLFSHSSCLVSRLAVGVPIHPDLLED